MTILFVSGLLFVSAVKNETRNLEKEIDSLRASNKEIKFNLDQAILDNEVITSPENISHLAREYLNIDLADLNSQLLSLNEKLDIKDENLQKRLEEIKLKNTELSKLNETLEEKDQTKTYVAFSSNTTNNHLLLGIIFALVVLSENLCMCYL